MALKMKELNLIFFLYINLITDPDTIYLRFKRLGGLPGIDIGAKYFLFEDYYLLLC